MKKGKISFAWETLNCSRNLQIFKVLGVSPDVNYSYWNQNEFCNWAFFTQNWRMRSLAYNTIIHYFHSLKLNKNTKRPSETKQSIPTSIITEFIYITFYILITYEELLVFSYFICSLSRSHLKYFDVNLHWQKSS